MGPVRLLGLLTAPSKGEVVVNLQVSLKDIEDARARLRGFVHPTETDLSRSTSNLVGHDVWFKYENLQRTGSFKIRGAFNKIMNLTAEEKKRGVVASSAGNHAQGVALSAQMAGVKATIVMPVSASLNKVLATKAYGAEVIFHGEIYDDAYAKAREIEKETGAVFVHPYEDPLVIAGQGTVGLEILEAVPDLDTILVAVGGGGLIAGIGRAIKSIRPQCKVYGIQSDQVSNMQKMFRHEPVETAPRRISTIADGIAVKKASPAMYENFLSKDVDDIVTVSDDEVAAAIVFLLERTKNLVEGAGAAAVAALLAKKVPLGKKNCAVLCGGNIDLNVISKVIERGQIRSGRLAELSVVVDDQPGSLNRLTKVLADERANILQVHHDRVEQGLFLRETRIDFLLETTSHDHISRIKKAFEAIGAKLL